MIKYTIPSVLIAITLVAGIFAFMPIEQATTVHTTIQASTTHLVSSTQEATATNDEFRVTCPTSSDGCIINEAFLLNENITAADIDSIQLEVGGVADFELADDNANGNVAQDNVLPLTGVSELAIGNDDAVCFSTTGVFTAAGNAYSLKVIATVEGDLSDITIDTVLQATGC